ncbi:MAG: hypothetical protein IJQ28_04630, partial [Clostridia bacterium]|nr:hypothetical protein [Clostridia bacterium]
HTYVSRLLDETVWFIKNAMKHFNHKKIMYNALPTYNIADNCTLLMSRLRTYIFWQHFIDK